MIIRLYWLMNAGLKNTDIESSGVDITTLDGIQADFAERMPKAVFINPIALVIGTWVVMNDEFSILTESGKE